MRRGIGITELLKELPGSVVVAFAFITQLGDFWFVAAASLLAYLLGEQLPWLGRGLTRERAAMVVALLVTAAALTVSLKALFELPRPRGAAMASPIAFLPEAAKSLYVSLATGTGYGFPSGHAITTTLVWGGFAWALRVGTPRQRYAVAGTAVVLVSLARLVLGVHFLVDVVAGALVAGFVLLLSVRWLGDPAYVFGLALGLAVFGILVGGFDRETAAVLGMAAGATVAWLAVDEDIERTRRGRTLTAVAGLGLLAVGGAVFRFLQLEPGPLAVVVALATGSIVALPLVGERLAKNPVL